MVPKILSPGGDVLSVKAAILAGADEVYLGVSEFNARRRADNITFEELNELVRLASQRGVHLFLTLNTLLCDDEFSKIIDVIHNAVTAGISAFIVQDLGLMHILQKHFPDQEIHGSTQLTTHNAGQIDFFAEKGISRINLARELSLEEISNLSKHAHIKNMEIEVFVHGAYCISYSGQCYMSSFMGGKSGNRGICFQPCRRLYYAPHSASPRYKLNLKDNNQLHNAEALADAGVDSLKIEGRIKGFYYVYTVTKAWKNSGNKVDTVFNRGFHSGYADKKVGPEMFAETGPGDQSLESVAEIKSYNARERILRTKSSALLSERDQILIYTRENRFICTGKIVGVLSDREFLFQIEHELRGKILPDQIILKNSHYREQEILQEEIDRLTVRKDLLSVQVSGSAGSPLRSTWISGNRKVDVESSLLLEKAKNTGLDAEKLNKPFSRLDNKFLEIGTIDTGKLESDLFLPVSELNKIRRLAMEALFPQAEHKDLCPELPEVKDRSQAESSFVFYINRAKDLKLLLKSGILGSSIFFEVTDPADYDCTQPCIPWFPAIIPQDALADFYRLVDRLPLDIPLVADNLAIAHYARRIGRKWIGGNRLNITNSFAVQSLKEAGAEGFILSCELNKRQIEPILRHAAIQPYFILFGPVLLMETKQCLVRQEKGCKKAFKDHHCYSDCRFSSSMYDENKNKFLLEKRPFRENEIYNGSYLYTPETVKDLKDFKPAYMVDLRRFSFFNPTEIQFQSILKEFRGNQIEKKPEPGLPLTRGNYNRGLS